MTIPPPGAEQPLGSEPRGRAAVVRALSRTVREAVGVRQRACGYAPGALRLRRGRFESGRAHQVVGGCGELQPEAVARLPHVAQLAAPAHRLELAEDLLHPLTAALAHGARWGSIAR